MYSGVIKFLWKNLAKLKYLFLLTLVGRILAEFCVQKGIFYSSRIVGVISGGGDKADMFHYALYFAMLFAAYNLVRGVIHNSTAFLEARFLPLFNVKMARLLFSRAHTHSMQFFSEEMSGRVATKVRQTIRETRNFYGNGYNVTNSVIKMLITFYFILRVKWTLTVLLLGFFIFYFTYLFWGARRLVPYYEASYDKSTVADGILVDSMFNYSLVRNFTHLFFEKLNYFKKLHVWAGTEKTVYYKEANLFMAQGVARALLQLIFLLASLWYWTKGEMSVADFVLVEGLVSYLALYCMDIVMSTARLMRNFGGIKDGLDFLYRPLHIKDVEGASELKVKRAEIRFENVTFGYKSGYETVNGAEAIMPILFEHFNLKIKAGSSLGLAGHSGSGKSSLIKLLNRYYDVSDGRIMINNHNIAEVTQDSLRHHIAVIPQDSSLFNRSIMENIRYGRLGASEEEVLEAAKKAYCHEFIMNLPQGYQSHVGERGITLSGGERQRIAIARAILKDAPILILDEATSALDSESELYIKKALVEVMKGKTVIAIAHRLSTLREMDRILVMAQGKIIEEGSHEALYRKKGAYFDFYQLQKMRFRR